MISKRDPFVLWLLAALLIGVSSSRAEDWPEFRGPTGQGHSRATGVPVEWSDTSDAIRWRTSLPGSGWSSVSTSDGIGWTTTSIDDEGSLRALAIDLDTGKIVTNVEVFQRDDLGKIHSKNSHASPTPVIDGDRVYVHFGEHGTACLSQDGQVLWRRQFEYGHFHGPGGSPVVWQDRLILSCDGDKEQFVVALDKMSGETIWKTKRTHISPERFTGGKMVAIAFTTPLLHDTPAGMHVISPAADHVAAYDARSGEEIWWCSYDGYSNVPRPVVGHDHVYVASGYNRSVLYAIRLGGTGDVTSDRISWTLERGAPLNPSPIIVGDEIYTVSDNGILTCMDAVTGDQHWQERIGRAYSASPLHVGGLLYWTDESGTTTVIRPGKTFEMVAVNSLDARTLASLTPMDGAMLIRTEEELLRIDGPSLR